MEHTSDAHPAPISTAEGWTNPAASQPNTAHGSDTPAAASLAALDAAITNNQAAAEQVIDLKQQAAALPAYSLSDPRFANPIALHELSQAERKVIEKLAEAKYKTATARDLLAIDPKDVSKLENFGRSSMGALKKLQYRLVTDPSTIRKFMAAISFSSIERELLEVIEMSKRLPAAYRDFAIKRLGLFGSYETKRSLAKAMGITEGGATKIEKRCLAELRLVLRHPLKGYQKFLRENTDAHLIDKLFQVYNHFQNERFYRFVEKLFELEREELLCNFTIKHVNMQACLDAIFQEMEMPCPIDQFSAALHEKYSLTPVQVDQFLSQAKRENRISCTYDEITWAALSPKSAIAQVLLPHPDGLHWRKIVRTVNRKKLSTSRLLTHRELRVVITLHDIMMRCEQGTYRHMLHSNLNSDVINEALAEIKAHLSETQAAEVPMREMYRELGLDQKITYFELRHIASTALVEHFIGVSNRDVLSKMPRRLSAEAENCPEQLN